MPITRARPPRKPKPAKVVVRRGDGVRLSSLDVTVEARGASPSRDRTSTGDLPITNRQSSIVSARSPAEIAKARRIDKLRERGY